MYKKENCFDFERDIFMDYFHKNLWTWNLYDEYIAKLDIRTRKDFPNSRTIRRFFVRGYIPVKQSQQLCKLFNCKPEQLGIIKS